MTKLQSFRNEISNYNFYKQEIVKLKEQIDDKFYQIFGLHAVDPSKYFLENKNYKAQEYQMLDSLEKFSIYKEEKLKQIKRMQDQVDYVDEVLLGLDNKAKSVFTKIYIEERSYRQASKELDTPIGELQYIMKKSFKED